MSLNFLVEHDRHGKIPTRVTIYEDLRQANERLYRLEDEQMDELNAGLEAGKPVRMEYVVLGGESLETIKHTHARYFGGEYEVVKPTEISYIASWREKLNWTREERISIEAEAFARAMSRR
ncbi:MAG: hypothetical protein J4G13_11385 [Dehalococcoidia bacterium]|nr:hypothetical protein [Dehalococcoidia bacterium]